MLRSVKYGLYGALLAGVVGGTVAWTNVDRTVHLVVDGQARTIHTSADSVGQIVKSAGFRPGAHDLLAPSASSHVKDGETIVLKRGRLLRLDVDGADQYVWTTAPTVAQALRELGFASTDFTSVSRSRRLPLGATDISVRTPKFVTVAHDGRRTNVTTTDATVGQLLTDLALTTGPYDRVTPGQAEPLTAGETVTLTRVVHKTVTTTRSVRFHTTTKHDPTLLTGTTRLAASGHKGLEKIFWAAVYVDGKLIGKTKIKTVLVHKPSNRVQQVGTKAPVVTAPAATPKSSSGSNTSSSGSSSSGSGSGNNKSGNSGSGHSGSGSSAPSGGSPKAIARAMLKDYGWSQDQFSCLDSMWSRESGWRVNAANPSGAYGIPQALPGSKMSSAGPDWQSNATTQIKWGLNYIASRYNSPCQAWSTWQSQGWY